LGKGAIEAISSQLSKELPGLRGFSARNIKNMRTFFEGWRLLEQNKICWRKKKLLQLLFSSALFLYLCDVGGERK